MNAVDPLLNQDSLGKPLVEPVADPWQVRGYQSWIMVKMRLDTIGFSGIRLLDRPIWRYDMISWFGEIWAAVHFVNRNILGFRAFFGTQGWPILKPLTMIIAIHGPSTKLGSTTPGGPKWDGDQPARPGSWVSWLCAGKKTNDCHGVLSGRNEIISIDHFSMVKIWQFMRVDKSRVPESVKSQVWQLLAVKWSPKCSSLQASNENGHEILTHSCSLFGDIDHPSKRISSSGSRNRVQ